MAPEFQKRAVTSTTNYVCDIDMQPTHVLVELLNYIGHDLKKVPLTDAESTEVDTLITATGNRRYGTGALFGGVSGSLVTIP
jgi:hypothetical protein